MQAIYQHWSELETIMSWAIYKQSEPLHKADIRSLNNSIRQIEDLTEAYMEKNHFTLADEDDLKE